MSMTLRTVEEALPAGFRFHPTDSELVCDYLMKMMAGCDQPPYLIVVDLNKQEPWEIPMIACVGGKEYYFYSQRDRKYATGHRTNRATISGYWKATGKDRAVLRKGTLVGMRKTLVFYQGRAPKGRKTEWVMHEFRLEGPLGPPKLSSSSKDQDWVLCRVFFKNSREVIAGKLEEMEYYSNGEENSPSSSSLPPLIDQFVTFDHQTQTTNPNNNHNHEHEQVPCFSNHFATDQTHTTTHHPSFSYVGIENPYFLNPKNMTPSSFGIEGLLQSADRHHHHHFGSYLNTTNVNPTATTSSSSCDQEKVLKAVLNQLTSKIESSGPSNNIMQGGTVTSPSFGEASTSDSLLSEVALSTMWNNHYN